MRDYNIESDLKQEKFEVIKLVQGDKGNKLTINVLEDGQPVNLTGCSITAKYKRADGQVINGSVINISNNSFDAVIDSDITKVSGTLKMLFSIEKDDVKVSTFLLLADVREGLLENTGSSGGSTGGGEVTVDLSNYYKKNETYSKAQIDSQFKDIAKQTVVEDNKLYLLKEDGTKIDEGTTLPTGGGSTIISNSSSNYKYEYMGMPFPKQDVYQAWPIAGVQYDKSIDKIMCLVSDADGHSNATKLKITLYSLNPQTSEISEIKVVREGNISSPTLLHDAFWSQRGFLIDDDTGIYYKFHFGDDKVPKACKSTDKGITWTDISITETNSASILFAGGNGQIIKTSSGRIICGLFGNGFAYTDDYFKNLTYVTSGKIVSGGNVKIHEYEIIELAENELVALCRYSWNPTADGNWSPSESAYLDEMAWITYSHDNGTTWTVPVATNMRMDATNCCSFIDENNYINLFIGTRFFADGTTPFKVGMYFLRVSKDDLKNNNLKTGELMFYGNSEFYSDFGNLACCTDCRSNIHLFYNDGKESGTCRWHYIKGSRITTNNSNILEKPVNKEMQTYNAVVIDSLLELVYSHIGTVKKELLLKMGEMPDSGDKDNPTYWTNTDIFALYDFSEANFDTSVPGFVPLVGDKNMAIGVSSSPYGNGTQSSDYGNSMLMSFGNDFLNNVLKPLANNELGYTLEIDYYTSPRDNGGVAPSLLNGGALISGDYIELPTYSETIRSKFGGVGTYSIGANFDTTRKRNTFTWTLDRKTGKAYAYHNGVKILNSDDFTLEEGSYFDIAKCYAFVNNNNAHVGQNKFLTGEKAGMRFYSRPLTDDEILLNANYSKNLD